ncbi:Chloroplast stem-loop binding protein of 41 kDa a, chloroplastic [Gracilariopsis chorda]|uniref:Chloroplast stem-loop binding protein of 41 kDa a, chloroplastic n=1 Tax=Gracilariopsis chorda TaxID=448386 RepID=A0A2V3IVW4_9FLOR|nr:Chloroplast stem-loop binding protein of 41 kDa a, chloroplastic [Gracilariopsis chorda]|eukprot:PXF46288.1 Chloroplast stem-loop binding protein of 41 kDa a, chloroplastic [Gracilariopsis chorda]
MSAKVLIVNTKGGGHGHIGLHLARALLEKGLTVDMLQVGAETSKGPVGKYPQLASEYPTFSVRYGDVTDESVGTAYDAVYDNNAKSLEDIAPVIKAGKAGAEVFYVSSAGAYAYDGNVMPHLEGDAAKGATIDVENAIRDSGVSSINFRPIYIIGSASSKREYTDYFFDRIVRGRPILLPGTGSELTSLTDVRDVASMLAAAAGKGMKNETLNVTNTRCISFTGLVKLCEQACGKEAEVVCYDPERMKDKIDGFELKKAFPFRPRHFFADPGEAQRKLDWQAVYSGTTEGLLNTLKLCYEEYLQLRLDKTPVVFDLDDKILEQVVS